MEYTSALSTIIFNESCRLQDLTEAQVGCNQFAMDIVVDQLDREVDHASERLSMLEDRVGDLEAGYTELLALGQEQVETSTRCHRHGRLYDYRSTLLLYFAKSNSSFTLVDLIFLLILSYLTQIPSQSFSHFPYLPFKCAVYYVTSSQKQRTGNYLLVRRRTILLGQLEGYLGPDQLIR